MTQLFPPLPPIRLGYAEAPLNRAGHLREDDAWIARALAADDTRFYCLSGDLPILKPGEFEASPLFNEREAGRFGEPLEKLFLGLDGQSARFALGFPSSLADELKTFPGYIITDLRSIAMQGLVGPEHLSPLGEGKAMLFWHQRHGFCANCGTKTIALQSGWRRDCPGCKAQHFPRTDPVVIMVAVDGDHCLLGRQKQFPQGMFSALAGFMEPGETMAQAVRREIFEEAGIETGKVRYLADQPWPFPSSLMIGCLAQATSSTITVDTNELETARWFSREECYQMLTKSHPQNLFCPPPLAIAHHLMRAFVEGVEI